MISARKVHEHWTKQTGTAGAYCLKAFSPWNTLVLSKQDPGQTRCLWLGAESFSPQLPCNELCGGGMLCRWGCDYLVGLAGRRHWPWCFPAAREEGLSEPWGLKAAGTCKEASQGVLAALEKVSDWGNNAPESVEENIWEGERRRLGWAAASGTSLGEVKPLWFPSFPLCSSPGTGYQLLLQNTAEKVSYLVRF